MTTTKNRRRYKIADYLNDEQRARVAAAEFFGGACLGWTAEGNCPLGVAFNLGPLLSSRFARKLGRSNDRAFIAAAREFINDLDLGRIAADDIKFALGVDKE